MDWWLGQGSLFGDAVFLVFCNRAVAVLFACGMVVAKGESIVNAAPLWKYIAVSLSNVYASTCQYEVAIPRYLLKIQGIVRQLEVSLLGGSFGYL